MDDEEVQMALLERSFYNGIKFRFVSFVHFVILALADYGSSLSVFKQISRKAVDFSKECRKDWQGLLWVSRRHRGVVGLHLEKAATFKIRKHGRRKNWAKVIIIVGCRLPKHMNCSNRSTC
jgi:hypothetical protein